MSDFWQATNKLTIRPARVMTLQEALVYDWRKGSTNPDKYFTIDKARSLELINGYIVIPASYFTNTEVNIGDLLAQYEVSLSSNFSIVGTNIDFYKNYNTITNCGLFVKFRVGSIVYRYLLMGQQYTTSSVLPTYREYYNDYPVYTNQTIGRNCVFEIVRFGDQVGTPNCGFSKDITLSLSLNKVPSTPEEISFKAGTLSLKSYDALKVNTTFNFPLALNALYLDNTL